MIVLWRVTDQCNLACGFCAHDRRLPGPRAQADPEQIRRFAAVLADWSRAQQRPVLLSWLGGEPLLWPPLLALDRELHAWGLHLSQTSNGTRLHDPQIRRHLLQHYRELTLSVDAPGSLHEQLRGWRGGSARLQQGIAALLAERTRGRHALKLRVNTVLMHDTLPLYPELARSLAQAGVDELSFNLLGGRDRPEFFPAQRVRPAAWTDFVERLPALRAELAACGTRLVGSTAYLERLASASRGTQQPVQDCAPGTRFLFVDPAGRAAPCAQTLAEYAIPVEQISDVAALEALPVRYAALRARQRASVCEDCPSTQVWGKFEATGVSAPPACAQPRLLEHAHGP